VLSALALVLTLVAAAAERVRLLSRLRTLGLDGRQSGSLVAWEALPVVLPGVLVGLLVGVTVSMAVYPAVDLRAFTGGVERPAIAVDPLLLAASLAGVLVASGLAVVVAVLTGSRAQLGSMLRVGDET
jgi:putative ABC transport system permease protein